ncbi:MAG: hypothetical protein HY422_02650 [Candidatus Komeilibacteria bacterium]|nr:hypothetical protein [Candidatus Komeilibacteria bacterium]
MKLADPFSFLVSIDVLQAQYFAGPPCHAVVVTAVEMRFIAVGMHTLKVHLHGAEPDVTAAVFADVATGRAMNLAASRTMAIAIAVLKSVDATSCYHGGSPLRNVGATLSF